MNSESQSNELITFDDRIKNSDGITVIVSADEDISTSNMSSLCLFGSEEHSDALKKEKYELQSTIGRMKIETEFLSKRMSAISNQLDFLKNNLSGSKNHTVSNDNTNKAITDEIIIRHSTEKNFGKLADFKHLEPPSQNEYFLFHSLFIRQYFVDKTLHRSKSHRASSWDELFFDLIFVICIATVGHILRDHTSWETLYHFWILFYPIWCVWKEVTFYMNRYGTDDLNLKLFGLANSTMAIFMALTSANVFPYKEDSESTYRLFIGFFVITRVIVISGHCVHAFNFAKLRTSILFNVLSNSVPAVFFLISIFVPDSYRLSFYWTAFVMDFVFFYFHALLFRNIRARVALNIEHISERIGLFTIIVLGEMIAALNIFEVNSNNITRLFLGSFLGLIIALSFQAIYFDVDASKQFIHALRRDVRSGIIWNFLHFPLHGCLVISSAGLYTFLKTLAAEEYGLKPHKITFVERFLFLGFFGFSLLIISLIGLSHRSLDKENGHATNLSKKLRIFSRIVVSGSLILIAAFVPIDAMSPLEYIIVTACLVFFQAMIEEYGKLKKLIQDKKIVI